MTQTEKVTITMSARDLQAVVSYMQLAEHFHNATMCKHTEHVYNELGAVLTSTQTWQEENKRWQKYFKAYAKSNVVPFAKKSV